MAVESALQDLQEAYARLRQAAATARYACDHYLDELQGSFAQRLQVLESTYEQRLADEQATFQEQLAAAVRTYQQAGEQIREQADGLTAAFRWALAGWDDPAWRS